MAGILQASVNMATALEQEGHGTGGATATGRAPTACDPLLCHGTLPADCNGCNTLAAWREARAERCQRCGTSRPRHGSVPCEGATYDALDCREIVYRWQGDPAYRCVGPKGVPHSHADPLPEHMGQVFYDFTLAGGARDTVLQLTPNNDAARQWVEANVGRLGNGDGFQPYWPALVIEARFVDSLLAGIIGDDLTVERGQSQ